MFKNEKVENDDELTQQINQLGWFWNENKMIFNNNNKGKCNGRMVDDRNEKEE